MDLDLFFEFCIWGCFRLYFIDLRVGWVEDILLIVDFGNYFGNLYLGYVLLVWIFG